MAAELANTMNNFPVAFDGTTTTPSAPKERFYRYFQEEVTG